MKKLILAMVIIMLASIANASKPVDFTQEDRDRLITLEVKVENNTKQIKKFELTMHNEFNKLKAEIQKQNDDLKSQMQKQNDKLITIIMCLIGIFSIGMGIMIGLLFWDRRKAMTPIEKKIDEYDKIILEIKQDHTMLKKILTKLLKKDPDSLEFAQKLGLQI
ncbi:putative t-SNARE coiled-coil homology domain-containing protein [Candidatus Magnetomoraceae bacterium gMMP-15]